MIRFVHIAHLLAEAPDKVQAIEAAIPATNKTRVLPSFPSILATPAFDGYGWAL
jgi:hypothetical protein